MYEVERNSSAKSALKVAILTALNIADELFREREKRDSTVEAYESSLHQLNDLLDQFQDEGN